MLYQYFWFFLKKIVFLVFVFLYSLPLQSSSLDRDEHEAVKSLCKYLNHCMNIQDNIQKLELRGSHISQDEAEILGELNYNFSMKCPFMFKIIEDLPRYPPKMFNEVKSICGGEAFIDRMKNILENFPLKRA